MLPILNLLGLGDHRRQATPKAAFSYRNAPHLNRNFYFARSQSEPRPVKDF
jgi:hypothetical protein